MISIESFERIRELINRIVDLKEQLAGAFNENREMYSGIQSVIKVDGLSSIITEFSNSIYNQNGDIQRNLNTLFEFLSNQVKEYEALNQSAEARLQSTQGQLDGIVSDTSSDLGQI